MAILTALAFAQRMFTRPWAHVHDPAREPLVITHVV